MSIFKFCKVASLTFLDIPSLSKVNLSNSRRCILFFFFRYLAGEELDSDDSDQESDDDDNDDLDNPEDCTCLEDTSTSQNHQSQVDQLK